MSGELAELGTGGHGVAPVEQRCGESADRSGDEGAVAGEVEPDAADAVLAVRVEPGVSEQLPQLPAYLVGVAQRDHGLDVEQCHPARVRLAGNRDGSGSGACGGSVAGWIGWDEEIFVGPVLDGHRSADPPSRLGRPAGAGGCEVGERAAGVGAGRQCDQLCDLMGGDGVEEGRHRRVGLGVEGCDVSGELADAVGGLSTVERR